MYAQVINLNDSVDAGATVAGWLAPNYASNWNDVVQITYARSNYNENLRLQNTIQYEYVTKAEVGAVVDAYRKTRQNNTTTGYNPSDTSSFSATTTAVQIQLGNNAPSREKIALILKQFYHAVFGTPQQIPASWYTAGKEYASLTASQQQALNANQSNTTATAPSPDEECGFFCSIRKTFINLVQLPGTVAGGVSTSAKIMSIAVPVFVVGGAIWSLWIIGRKVMEMNADELGATVATRGMNKVVR